MRSNIQKAYSNQKRKVQEKEEKKKKMRKRKKKLKKKEEKGFEKTYRLFVLKVFGGNKKKIRTSVHPQLNDHR
ncbi:MAG: hypothetical protein Q8P67_21870 [archaeon]|nr:hypothetical protein [archaeon]